MKTLSEIQNEVAKEHNWATWKRFVQMSDISIVLKGIDEVCKRAQQECGRETLVKLSEKGDEFVTGDFGENDLISFKGGKRVVVSESNIVIIS